MRKFIGVGLFELLHTGMLLMSDAVSIYFCFWYGHKLWIHSSFRLHPTPPQFDLLYIGIMVGMMLMVLIWGGTYRFHHSISHALKLKELIRTLLIGYILAIMIGYFSKAFLFSRLWTINTFILLMPVTIAERGFVDWFWGKYVARGIKKKRVLIYGAGLTGKRLVKSMRKLAKLNYEIVGFLDDSIRKNTVVTTNPLSVLGKLRDLPRLVDQYTVDKLLITMPGATDEQMLKIINKCDKINLDYKFVPGLYDQALHSVKLEIIDGIPLFAKKELQISSLNLVVKRVFDIVFSIIMLLLLSPLMAFIAFLIRKESPGPAIFKQTRVGLNGKEFEFYKFRSMYSDVSPYAINPLKLNDKRVTKIGRFLRRTSLDELPQFLNVLKGEMSVVGPRPEMPFIVETYNETHRERLNVKPGITGLWQISGDRALPIHENIDHDLYYIEHQSFLLDIVIIVETILFAIKGAGAR